MQTTTRSRAALWTVGLFAALCSLFLLTSAAYAANDGLVGANIKDGQLLGYYGPGGDITIPHTVTTIAPEAFKNNDNVTSVTIPGSVSTIGYNAFEGCTELQAIYFSEPDNGANLTIRVSAFINCPKLTECTIPACAEYITGNVFKGCSSMTEIQVDPGNPYYFTDDNGVMFGPWVDEGEPQYEDPNCALIAYPCGRTGSYVIPSEVNGHPINQIWASGFRTAKGLTSVEIPASCTILGGNAFEGTSLREITIPSTVTSMGAGLLSNCKDLTDVVIEAPIIDLEMSMFDGSTSLQRVTFPSTLRTLGMYAFRNCTSISTLILPEGMSTMGSSIFDGCTNLQRVYVPRSVLTFPSVDGMYFDPFEDAASDLIVYVASGSNGEKWAINHAEEFGWQYQTVSGPQALTDLDVGTISLLDMGKKVKVTGAFHMGETLNVKQVTSGPQFDAFRNSTNGTVAVYQISMANGASAPETMALSVGRPKDMGSGAKLYTLKGSQVTLVPTNTVSGTLMAQVNDLGYFAVIDGEASGGDSQVDPTIPAEIKLSRTAASLTEGQKLQLSATVLPDTATDKSVTWKTSSASVAEVSSRGLVTAVSQGSATITATTANGLEATCKITVTPSSVTPPPTPTPTDAITAAASVRAGDDVTETGKIPFFVNLSKASRIATVQVNFETTGTDVEVQGQSGFVLLGQVNGQQKGGKFVGSAMLCYLQDGPGLFATEAEKSIARFTVIGEEPSFKVTGLTISGWDSQEQVAYGKVTGIEPDEDIFVGPMRFDLNKDGVVDQLDITWAQQFYRAVSGDANWNTAKRCDFNQDQLIDITDFIQILQNFTVSR